MTGLSARAELRRSKYTHSKSEAQPGERVCAAAERERVTLFFSSFGVVRGRATHRLSAFIPWLLSAET